MSDAVDQKQELRVWSQPKRFNIDAQQAKSNSTATLEALKHFIQTSIEAVERGARIENLAPDTLIISVAGQSILDRDYQFEDDLKSQFYDRIDAIQFLRTTLFPDDLVNIVNYIHDWLPANFGQELGTWNISSQVLTSELREASERRLADEGVLSTPMAHFTQNELKEALEEIFEKLEGLVGEAAETEFESIDELLAEIKENPIAVWGKVKALLVALTSGTVGQKSVILKDQQHEYAITDVRQVFNVFLEEIDQRIVGEDNTQPPWDRLYQGEEDDKQRKTQLISRFKAINLYREYQITDENENILKTEDLAKVSSFINIIDLLLKEIETEIAPAAGPAEAEVDDEGGADQEPDERVTPDLISLADITTYIYQQLPLQVWARIEQDEQFAALLQPLDQKQKDWLLLQVESYVRSEISRAEMENDLAARLSNNLDTETGRYALSQAEQRVLAEQYASDFLTTARLDDIVGLFSTIPGVDEISDEVTARKEELEQAVVAPVQPTDETVAAPTTEAGRRDLKEQRVQETTTVFISQYFPGLTPDQLRELQPFVQNYFRNNFSDNITVSEQNRLMRQLIFDGSFITKTDGFYQNVQREIDRKLKDLGLDSPQTLLNIYNTLDSMVILQENPEQIIQQLAQNGQLLSILGIDQSVNLTELQTVLIDLVRFRTSFLRLHAIRTGYELKPVFLDEEPLEDTSLIVTTRQIVSYSPTDAAAYVQLDEGEIFKSNLDAQKKRLIDDFRRQLFLNYIQELNTDERDKVYEYFQVFDYDQRELPVPDSFSFPALMQGVQSGDINIAKHGSRRFKRIKKKLNDVASKVLGKVTIKAIPGGVELTAALRAAGLKKVADWIEENTGKLIAGLGVSAAALVGLLTRSIGAAIGTLIGTIGGGFAGSVLLGGPWGTVFGAAAGGTAGGFIGHAIGKSGGLGGVIDSLRGLGGGGTSVAAVPSIASAITTATPVTVAVGTMAVTFAIINVTLSGSFIKPIDDPDAAFGPGGIVSPYVTMTKTSDTPSEVDSLDEATYTITITADKGYAITITEATDTLLATFKDENNEPIEDERILEDLVGLTLQPGESITIEYNRQFGSGFVDVRIINNVFLGFEYSNESEGGSSTAQTSYLIGVGDYPKPEGCWPATGDVTQGPFVGTHEVISGIDIFPTVRGTIGGGIYTPISGEACYYAVNSGKTCRFGDYCYGNHVVLRADAGSFLVVFAHMNTLEGNPGTCQHIDATTKIGTMGNTGTANVHLHYHTEPSTIDVNTLTPDPIVPRGFVSQSLHDFPVVSECGP